MASIPELWAQARYKLHEAKILIVTKVRSHVRIVIYVEVIPNTCGPIKFRPKLLFLGVLLNISKYVIISKKNLTTL